MLDHSETLAVQRDVRDQCTFIQGSAEVLKDIDDASVDAYDSSRSRLCSRQNSRNAGVPPDSQTRRQTIHC